MKTIVMSLASVLVVAGVSFAQDGGAETGQCPDAKTECGGEAKAECGGEAKAECGGEAKAECGGEVQQAKAGGCCAEEAQTAQVDDACGSEEGCGGCMEMASNPVFDQMKTLVGEWTGKRGEETMHVTYRLTANGTVLIETLMPGTPHEMLTVYHLDGSDLMLTHYCASGSQPTMKMKAVKDGAFHFEHVGGSNCDPAKGFMGGLVMQIADGKLKHNWSVLKDGKAVQHVEFELTRARETKK